MTARQVASGGSSGPEGLLHPMVRVREARRAFQRFRSICFWSCRPDLIIGAGDVPWVAEQLMKHGNRDAWRIGAKLVS